MPVMNWDACCCRCMNRGYGDLSAVCTIIIAEKNITIIENEEEYVLQIAKKKVLIIDDDELHLYTTKALLQDDRIDVVTHKNAFGATNLIESMKPDLILLDINMPALAGDRLVELIRAYCDANDIHIVFHSSNDEEILRISADTHGVRGYVCKGDVAGLREKVTQYLFIPEQQEVKAADDVLVTRACASSRPGIPPR